MAKGAITKRTIGVLPTTGKQHFLWDKGLSGFGVRVTPKGVKSYVYQYRLGSSGTNARRMTLGKCGEISPNQARSLAMEMALMVRQSSDPSEVKSQKAKLVGDRRRSNQELAFDAYCARYFEFRVKPEGLASAHNIEAVFRLHSIPVLGKKPLPEIGKRDIVSLIDRIPQQSLALRRSTYAILNRMFVWAKSRDDIDKNPMEGMKAPPPVTSRDRVLNDIELALALRAAKQMNRPFGPFIQLLFATGQRRDECSALDWVEIERSKEVWTLPAARSKNGKANIIPLNRHAIEALDRMAKDQSKEGVEWPAKGLVFTTTGKTPVSGYSRAKKRLDATMASLAHEGAIEAGHDQEVSINPWRLHDARRTLATGLQKLGVRFEVTEAVLNHVGGAKSGVAAVYQRHGWGPEKRAAMEAWASHCDRVLGIRSVSEKTIPIRSALSN